MNTKDSKGHLRFLIFMDNVTVSLLRAESMCFWHLSQGTNRAMHIANLINIDEYLLKSMLNGWISSIHCENITLASLCLGQKKSV